MPTILSVLFSIAVSLFEPSTGADQCSSDEQSTLPMSGDCGQTQCTYQNAAGGVVTGPCPVTCVPWMPLVGQSPCIDGVGTAWECAPIPPAATCRWYCKQQ